ncbi:hypothetical protein CEXT_680771 [Caerostris extrusa]|uniref:Uncharacterized protein n=1 Tax=Caerostris extrusa TaxID=172846 RepID=A0AAV4X2F4_CAEEX|nr:hypothetical protein CEXT_680771 [Caerostris extrusa]
MKETEEPRVESEFHQFSLRKRGHPRNCSVGSSKDQELLCGPESPFRSPLGQTSTKAEIATKELQWFPLLVGPCRDVGGTRGGAL